MRFFKGLSGASILLLPILGLLLIISGGSGLLSEGGLHFEIPFALNSLKLALLSTIPFAIAGIAASWAVLSDGRAWLVRLFITASITLFFIHPVVLLGFFKMVDGWTDYFSALTTSSLVYGIRSWAVASIFSLTLFSGRISGFALYAARSVVSPGRVFVHIVLPQLLKPFAIISLPLLMLNFFSQDVPSILGYRTYGEYILSNIILSDDISSALASMMPTLAVLALFLSVFWAVLKNSLHNDFHNPDETSGFQKPLAGGVLQFVWTAVPLILLSSILFVLLKELIASDVSLVQVLAENGGTLFYTTVITSAAAAVGMVAARVLYETTGRSEITVYTMLLYFFLPNSLLALMILEVYQYTGFNSQWSDTAVLLAGYMYALLPAAYFMLWLEKRYFAKDDFFRYVRITPWRRFLHVELPEKGAVWTLQFLILAVLALYELDIPLLLAPAGTEVLVVRIYNLLHYGDTVSIAILSMAEIIAGLAVAAAAVLLAPRRAV